MEKATIIGIDLAKRVFQVHAASKDGRPVWHKKVARAQPSSRPGTKPRAGRAWATLRDPGAPRRPRPRSPLTSHPYRSNQWTNQAVRTFTVSPKGCTPTGASLH